MRSLVRRVFSSAIITFSLLGNGLGADTGTELRHATAAFYSVYLETRPSGIPNARARAKFTPVISHTLAQLLERADAAERNYAKVTKKQLPPLVEGDLFTSLFEGAQAFSVEGCTRSAAATTCVAALRYTDASDQKTTRWTDKVYVVRNAGRWVVDDIEFGGNWPFMHRGHLKELLRKVIVDGNHARP